MRVLVLPTYLNSSPPHIWGILALWVPLKNDAVRIATGIAYNAHVARASAADGMSRCAAIKANAATAHAAHPTA